MSDQKLPHDKAFIANLGSQDNRSTTEPTLDFYSSFSSTNICKKQESLKRQLFHAETLKGRATYTNTQAYATNYNKVSIY